MNRVGLLSLCSKIESRKQQRELLVADPGRAGSYCASTAEHRVAHSRGATSVQVRAVTWWLARNAGGYNYAIKLQANNTPGQLSFISEEPLLLTLIINKAQKGT